MRRTVMAIALLGYVLAGWADNGIERIKLGDNELNCRQIFDEIAEMDKIMATAREARAAAEKDAGLGEAGSVAAEVASRSGLFGRVGGLFGHIAGSVGSKMAADSVAQSGRRAAQQAQAREEQAKARKEHLSALFTARGCRASDPDAPAANPQAKIALPAQTAVVALSAEEVIKRIGTNATPLAGELKLKTNVINMTGKNLGFEHKRVFIPNFRVAYVVKTKAHAYAGAGLANIGNTAPSPIGVKTVTQAQNKRVEMALTGADQKLLQALTDRLYEDFVARVRAAGREVVAWEEVRKTPGYDKIRFTEARPYTVDPSWTDADKRSYLVFTPSGMPLFFVGSTSDTPLADRTFDLQTSRAIAEIATHLNAVALIPTLQIDIAEVRSSGRSRWRSDAEADLIPKLGLVNGSRLYFANGMDAKIFYHGDVGTANLEEPFYVEGEFGSMKTVDAFDTASLANALTMATGAQGVQYFNEKRELRVDPERYASGVLRVGATFNDRVLAALESKRLGVPPKGTSGSATSPAGWGLE